MVLFFLAILIPPVYLSLRILRTTRWRLGTKLLTCLLLLVISQVYTINTTIFKTLAGPDMPSWLLMTQLWLFFSLILFFLMQALSDIARLVFRLLARVADLVRKPSPAARMTEDGAGEARHGQEEAGEAGGRAPHMGRRRFLQGSLASAGLTMAAPAVCLAASAAGVDNGVSIPVAHRMEALVPNLPAGLDGLRIAHVTDIHFGTLTSVPWARAMVQKINDWEPDLVCITGDIADGLRDYSAPGCVTREQVARELGGLRARCGVFGCTGNHEYISDYRGWMDLYESLGLRMLLNESVHVDRGNARLVLTGLNDIAAGRRGMPVGRASEVLAGEPDLADGAFRLVMDHHPGKALENTAAGAHMQLSGHTHGGHLFGMDRIIAAANNGFVRGWYDVSGMPLYVSNGAGLWSGFAIRLGIPAEVALITLRCGQGSFRSRG